MTDSSAQLALGSCRIQKTTLSRNFAWQGDEVIGRSVCDHEQTLVQGFDCWNYHSLEAFTTPSCRDYQGSEREDTLQSGSVAHCRMVGAASSDFLGSNVATSARDDLGAQYSHIFDTYWTTVNTARLRERNTRNICSSTPKTRCCRRFVRTRAFFLSTRSYTPSLLCLQAKSPFLELEG